MNMENGDQELLNGDIYVSKILGGPGVITPKCRGGVITPRILGGGK